MLATANFPSQRLANSSEFRDKLNSSWDRKAGMKIGDRVEVVAVPESLPSGMGTQALFAACVGRVFPIEGIDDNGLLQLHVGEVVGEESYMHSIWIEADCVLLRANN
jgi:hypothetical protein